MATINVEVLKQLLDDFTEKQAMCAEEIVAIEQQIGELQELIASCRQKMEVVSQDRAKVFEMMNRYGAQAAAAPRMTLVKPVQQAQTQTIIETQTVQVANGRPEVAAGSMAAKAAAAQMAKAAPVQTSAPVANPLRAIQAAQVAAPQAHQQIQPPPPPVAAPSIEEDETVKNINDALRGLFR
jgi:hypothetical protein